MPLLHKTRHPCFFPCDFAPSPLYQERCSLQSFEIIFLQFSTSMSVSGSNLYHVFSVGCCDLPYSPQNDLPLLCDISGKSVSRFEQVLLLQAFCAHSGGEKHLIISCRGQSLPDWCPRTDLILPLGMRLTSLHEIHQLPDCRSSASAGMLVLVTRLVLFCCFIPFYSQCWHRRRGGRSEIEQIGEDMNLNSGEDWNWIL